MTTLEYCVKYDFVAPLNDEEHGNNPKMKNLKPLTELFPYYYKQLKKNLFQQMGQVIFLQEFFSEKF